MKQEQDAASLGFVGNQSTEVVRAASDAVATVKYEIMALVEVARMSPRDDAAVMTRMLTMAKRPAFADGALYAFPRGNKTVSGPSVKMARPIAAAYGNVRYGVRVLSMDGDYCHIQGFAHDVEHGAMVTSEDKFKLLIQRKKKNSDITEWVKPDERDLRELVNRHGAVLERNCILKLIPPDMIEAVTEQCNRTLIASESGNLQKSRADTIRDLVMAFDGFGVKRDMIETYIGHHLDTIAPEELVQLRNVYNSIKDGNTKTSDHFDIGVVESKKPTPTVKMDMDTAKSVPARDPAGGSPIVEVKTSKPEPTTFESADATPIVSHWHLGIEIFPASLPNGWLDRPIATAGVLVGLTYRSVHESDSKDVHAEFDRLIAVGAQIQQEKGAAAKPYQMLAESKRLHESAAPKKAESA